MSSKSDLEAGEAPEHPASATEYVVLPEKAAPLILCVDDEPTLESLLKQLFRHHLKNGELAFLFARSLSQARAFLEEHPETGLLLCDINLPGECGIDLLRELRDKQRDDLPVVMLTAYGDMQNIRHCMNLGAYDFIQKPFDYADLAKTLFKGLQHAANMGRYARERAALNGLNKEIELARQLQRSFLPPAWGKLDKLKGCLIYGHFEPSGELGGDFFDYFQPDRDTLVFLLGDVSGSGVSGAIGMAMCQSLVRALAMTHKPFDLERVVRTLNAVLWERNRTSYFVSLFIGALKLTEGLLSYTNAGQCRPFVLKSEGDPEVLEQSGGLVLGVDAEKSFPVSSFRLEKSDSLFLYTDGLLEAINGSGAAFGLERVKLALGSIEDRRPDILVKETLAELKDFLGGRQLRDDTSLLALRYDPSTLGLGPT